MTVTHFPGWVSLPDTEVTFVPDRSSITVTWKATDAEKSSKDVVRKISLRRFSQDNVTQLYVLEDFNSTSEGLQVFGRTITVYTLQGLCILDAQLARPICMTTNFLPRGLTTFSGHTRSGLHENYQISPF